MPQRIRILLVEDSPEDTELLLRDLRRGGYEPEAERVACAEAMSAALERGRWDLVLADYVVPGFGGLEALALVRAKAMDVPFIIVSGHIGEDIAVAAMKAGADDYLMKDRLGRLGPAIGRVLQEAEGRRARKRAGEALRASEERFRELAENTGAAFFMFQSLDAGGPGSLSYVSPAYEKIWGYPSEALFWDPDLWLKAVHPEDRERILKRLPLMRRGQFNEEFRIVRMDLGTRWVHYRAFPVRDATGEVYRVAGLAEDITERKQTEQQLAVNSLQLQHTVEQLRAIEGELEKRVRERTAELTAANRELQRQIQERKRLENELLDIAKNERRRIGFDLHDDLGQKLMGVSLLLKALERDLTHKHVPEARDTRQVRMLINQVINHTHDLAHCFSSFDSQAENLCELIRKLAADVRRDFQINCRFRVTGNLPPVSEEVTLHLHRIAQESVSNAVKHAKAAKVTVSLSSPEDQLVLEIQNDGLPFVLEREEDHRMGLRIMKYRAEAIGAVLEVHSGGGTGTTVTCRVPCARQRGASSINLNRADAAPAPMVVSEPALTVGACELPTAV